VLRSQHEIKRRKAQFFVVVVVIIIIISNFPSTDQDAVRHV